MANSVIRGTGYVLVHVPGMVMDHGTTQTTERVVNPDSDYLKEIGSHMRSFEQVVNYAPNQTYIGNMSVEELTALGQPWYEEGKEVAGSRYGKFGEIMPEAEFILLMQACDAFDLVRLEKNFVDAHKAELAADPVITDAIMAMVKDGVDQSEVDHFVNEEHAEAFTYEGKVVGYVKRAHDIDANLSAHVMFENLVAKASGALSILHLLRESGVDPSEVEYVIDCCEEACGDMNQRGGGNFAKAEAEVAGLINATGSDARGFCAGPSHAMVEAAALVKSGAYKNVVVVGGGCTAKLGMNGKDHVKKGLPVLEDCLGGFAILVSENDGKNPEINLDVLGRHTVGTSSSPQAVIQALVMDPIQAAGMKVTDIDKFSPELQNPDILKPAGAGDVTEANTKMIAALAVKLGMIEKTAMKEFMDQHGLSGFAPTQGHIPSGVPYLGFARQNILEGKMKYVQFIGKGSLFLGRMTNLFDGVSFLVQPNSGKDEAPVAGSTGKTVTIGIAAEGTELGRENLEQAVAMAAKKGVKAVILDGGHEEMEAKLASGEIDAAVASHYPFPIGVSTVGRVVTPAMGKEMFIANTTGTSSTERVSAMVLNTVAGIIAAKACGIANPTVGIANVDGARQAEMALKQLSDKGYKINFTESSRADGGAVMRGNDLLKGTPDIMVMDSLTGNLMMKMFGAYTTGGSYESVGYGYGPGLGQGYDKLVLIVSRASGAPVIANACAYAAELINSGWYKLASKEYTAANKAGLAELVESIKAANSSKGGGEAAKKVEAPAKETVTFAIPGIEVTDIEDAVSALWAEGIYAESGMGCTGPVVMVSDANGAKATEVLKSKSYIG